MGLANLSTLPLRPDTIRILEIRILNALRGGGGGSGGSGTGGAGMTGVVNPEGSVTATPGTTYYNTANQSFWTKGSGSGNTGWVQLIG